MKPFILTNWFKLSILALLVAGLFVFKHEESKPLVVIPEEKTCEPSIALAPEDVAYRPTVFISDDYVSYTKDLDKVCPFVSSAYTSTCFDNQISIQNKKLQALNDKIIAKAKQEEQKYIKKGDPVDLEISGILSSVPEYMIKRKEFIQQICSLKNFATTGSAIGEEMGKCTMYYNEKDLSMLGKIDASL